MDQNVKVMAPADSKIPEGPVAEKWTNYKAHQKLVNPANKRRLDIIVVGTGLAGASAASTLAELGFNVLNFCIQDSPRRAHSIAAQGDRRRLGRGLQCEDQHDVPLPSVIVMRRVVGPSFSNRTTTSSP